MKKYLFVATVLFALSCKNNDSKAKEQSTETKAATNTLYGKWKVVGQSINGENRNFAEGVVQFKESGEFLGLTGVVFKYTINGDSLILTSEENKTTDKCKILLSEVEKGSLKFQTLVQDSLHIETVFQKEN